MHFLVLSTNTIIYTNTIKTSFLSFSLQKNGKNFHETEVLKVFDVFFCYFRLQKIIKNLQESKRQLGLHEWVQETYSVFLSSWSEHKAAIKIASQSLRLRKIIQNLQKTEEFQVTSGFRCIFSFWWICHQNFSLTS